VAFVLRESRAAFHEGREAIVRIAKVLALVLAMGLAPGAGAIPWMEVGEAGDLPATAQVPAGSGELTSISGSILLISAMDADMYRLHIPVPGAFSATTFGTVGPTGTQLLDSQLFLFDAAGFGVYGRDNNPGTARTTLPAGSLLGPQVPGDYFLAISGFNRDPVSAGGLIFPSSPSTTLHGPTGPGGAQPISGWTGLEGFSGRGNYRIDLTGAEFVSLATPVPEPGTLLLLAAGLLGMLTLRRCRFFLTAAQKLTGRTSMKQLYASLIAAFFLLPLSAAAGGVPWGEPNDTSGRFIVLSSYNNQAVFDSETGLVWEQSPSTTPRQWGGPRVLVLNSAQFHCNNMNVGNRKGWRLPTIQELASLVDPTVPRPGPTLPAGHPFSNVQSAEYWSATTAPSFTVASFAWTVSFFDGLVFANDKSATTVFVWCVRGGQGVDPQ
jgi:hypothetical protein